ncbi:hypothetical protein AB6A23_27280 [Paenibacillus tarimensis]
MKKLISAIAAVALCVGLLGTAVAAPKPDKHVKSEPYEWGRAQVVGGGFIPGIIFNETEKDLIYARTDIGEPIVGTRRRTNGFNCSISYLQRTGTFSASKASPPTLSIRTGYIWRQVHIRTIGRTKTA